MRAVLGRLRSFFNEKGINLSSLGISVMGIIRTRKTRKTRSNTEKSLFKMLFPYVSVKSVCSVYGFSR